MAKSRSFPWLPLASLLLGACAGSGSYTILVPPNQAAAPVRDRVHVFDAVTGVRVPPP